MKHRLCLMFDTPGWAYHKRCLALQKYAPDDFEVSLCRGHPGTYRDEPQDIYLQLCYSQTRNLHHFTMAHFDHHPLIVAGLNVGHSKHAVTWFRRIRKHADWVLINNRDCWQHLGQPPRSSWLSNGVDRSVLGCQVPIAERRPRVLWVGSYFHRTSGVKGYAEYLIPLQEELARRGIACDFRVVNSHGGPTRWTADKMRDWYNAGTVYVVASSAEGTPNPALEAASCGCTVVSTRVGNMPELIEDGVNGYLVDRSLPAITDGVMQAVANYERLASAMQETIRAWDWEERAKAYFAFFRRLLSERSS